MGSAQTVDARLSAQLGELTLPAGLTPLLGVKDLPHEGPEVPLHIQAVTSIQTVRRGLCLAAPEPAGSVGGKPIRTSGN